MTDNSDYQLPVWAPRLRLSVLVKSGAENGVKMPGQMAGGKVLIHNKNPDSDTEVKMITGLEMARSYFTEWGLPFLQHHFPSISERVAAGIWRGSQIFGADDELSTDHGWGATFTLVLAESDFQSNADRLEQALQKNAPPAWKGFPTPSDAEIIVTSIDRFFQEHVGFSQPPEDSSQWLEGFHFRFGTRETELYLIRHGHLFYDPLGEFTARRNLFVKYPRDIRYRRINQEILNVWHYGQYNFIDRLSRRNDPVANCMALGHFSEGVMRLCMLFDDDYTPYWKWLAFEFRKHSAAQSLDPMLRRLATSTDIAQQVGLINEICDFIHKLLQTHQLASTDLSVHPHPLFCDLLNGPLADYA